MLKQKVSLHTTQRSVSRMMWGRLFLVFLVGAAGAEHFQAWKTDTEYEFNVRSRTLASLRDVANKYTGIVLRARLTVKPKSEDTLEAKVWKAQYAEIRMAHGWKAKIPDNKLNLKQFPMSEKVFEIKMKNGVIRELIVENDVPIWELNVLKSIVSQLQVDTQGGNSTALRNNEKPEGDRNNAKFKTMEDSVGGKCEVLYEIRNLRKFVIQRSPELVPIPQLRGKGKVIDIVKTKNYSNCEQRMSHHFDINGSNRWEVDTNGTGKFISRSSVSRIVITGNLKTFTIQSSVTTNEVIMSPSLHENQKGMVSSMVNVTLAKIGPVSSDPWSTPTYSGSTGSLVYSSGNSLQSDEEQSYWHPGPTLNDPPSTPLLPFFDRFQVRSINESEEVDHVTAAKRVASQIGSDLQNPKSVIDEQTLEKFTILARLIRTMSTKQIAEVQSEIYQSENEMDPHDASQIVRSNTWAAFRDAVTQAGTGPALVTIKNWIKEKKIEGPEAASVVGALPQTARTPTSEYMDALFELVTMPETTNQEILNSTAMIAFAELIRYSQVNHESAHNRYLVHSFSRLSPKHNPAIFRDYVPYMSEQLKKSIKNNEAAKSHVFIRALGNVAHPNILAIFEPYLEGKIPASTFQRTLMVFSMNKLASLRPELARGVLYKIYQNTAEAHQVRCAAVAVLMSTNPPESMLRRMAEFTNSDHSKQVNAVVKSAIESACELRTPEYQVLAQKARKVRFLLNKKSYSRKYSRNYFWNRPEKMIIAHQSQAYFGSDDSFFPQVFYASMKAIYGDLQAPKLELAAMVSSVKELYRELRKQFEPHNKNSEGNHEEIQFSPENIAKLLKIEDDDEDLEGVVWTKSKYNNRFMSFDKHSLWHIPELLKKAAASLKEGRSFNMAKLESCDLALSFPMESGFPFVYTLKVPALLKASGSFKGENALHAIKGSIDLRLVYSMQVQARLGFVTPFRHQYYMAGVNKNLQVYVPIHAEVKYDKSEKQVTLKIQPIEQNEENKVVHYTIVPFISHYNIIDLLPVIKNHQTHKLRSFDQSNEISEYGLRTRGIHFKLETAPAGPFLYRNGWGWDLPGDATFPVAEANIEASRTELTMIPSPSSEQSVILTGSFQTLHDVTTKYDQNRINSSLKGKAPKIKSMKINDPERRSEVLKEVAEGIAAADAFAIDFGIELPGQEPFRCIMTTAFANSNVDEKFRGLTSWSCTDSHSRSSTESCVDFESKRPKSSPILDGDKTSSPTRNFDVDIRFGNTCEEGYKVQIRGKQKQTDAFKKAVYEPAMLECMKGINRSMQSIPACMEARAMNSIMDKSRIIIKFDPEIGINRALQREWRVLTDLFPELELRYHDDKSIENNTVIISVSFVQTKPEYEANIAIKTADLWLVATDAGIDRFAVLFTDAHPGLSTNDRLNIHSNDHSSEQLMCVVDSKSATTFDNATYPVELGECWHVAMTTYPKKNKDNKATEQIDEDMEVSVVVRDAEENRKEAKIVLGKSQLKFTSDGFKVRVQLNGKTVDFSEKRNYRQKNYDGDLDFEIVQGADGSITLSSPKRHVAVTYNGECVQIAASGKYRNDVRGLCGNYDGEPANDFMSPRNCLLSKSDQFVGSYAITSSECQRHSLQNARKANEADCIRITVRPGDVAGNSEAGRSRSGKNNWGFHNNKNSDERNLGSHPRSHCTIKRTKIIEEYHRICFSLRPVPFCASGCKVVYSKAKEIPFYCMHKCKSAQKMVDRIKQDANPDLTRKWLSKKKGFNRPVQFPHCVKWQESKNGK